MDATTFTQLQMEAQATIDTLNQQIAALTLQKNDLINVNNTTISNTQLQAQKIVDDANTKAQEIIDGANANATNITSVANKAKSDSDAYIATQQEKIDGQNIKLKSDQDALISAQSELANNIALFNSNKASVVSDVSLKITNAKAYLDYLLNEVQKLGS